MIRCTPDDHFAGFGAQTWGVDARKETIPIWVQEEGVGKDLTTDDPTAATPLAGRAVLMTLGSGSTAQSCTGTTNATGDASCTIGNVTGDSGGCHQTAGSAPVSVTFAGDAYYRPAGASGTVTIAALADTGGFVIGDKSAGTPPSPVRHVVRSAEADPACSACTA